MFGKSARRTPIDRWSMFSRQRCYWQKLTLSHKILSGLIFCSSSYFNPSKFTDYTGSLQDLNKIHFTEIIAQELRSLFSWRTEEVEHKGSSGGNFLIVGFLLTTPFNSHRFCRLIFELCAYLPFVRFECEWVRMFLPDSSSTAIALPTWAKKKNRTLQIFEKCLRRCKLFVATGTAMKRPCSVTQQCSFDIGDV